VKTHSLTIRLEAELERELEAVCAETGRCRGSSICSPQWRELAQAPVGPPEVLPPGLNGFVTAIIR
jgi:hypothetical protein